MQLLAENVYASTFSYRSSEGKRVEDLFPNLFKYDDYEMESAITQKEQDELQALMAAENARLASQKESSEE